MKLVKPSTEIITPINGKEVLQTLELVARNCYKSENKITESSAEDMVAMLIRNGHEAMIEFFDITVRFVCDRGVSHEIVRHRLASYAQESTRYCNYSLSKFDNNVTYVIPSWFNLEEGVWDANRIAELAGKRSAENEQELLGPITWVISMYDAEKAYNKLIEHGWKAQQARSVLPNSLKTEIIVKMNLREWRHFFKMRTSTAAHPQMRELTIPLLKEFQQLIPIVFDDLT